MISSLVIHTIPSSLTRPICRCPTSSPVPTPPHVPVPYPPPLPPRPCPTSLPASRCANKTATQAFFAGGPSLPPHCEGCTAPGPTHPGSHQWVERSPCPSNSKYVSREEQRAIPTPWSLACHVSINILLGLSRKFWYSRRQHNNLITFIFVICTTLECPANTM